MPQVGNQVVTRLPHPGTPVVLDDARRPVPDRGRSPRPGPTRPVQQEMSSMSQPNAPYQPYQAWPPAAQAQSTVPLVPVSPPRKKRHRVRNTLLTFAGVLALIITLAGIFGSGDDSTPTSAPVTTVAPAAPATTPAAEPAATAAAKAPAAAPAAKPAPKKLTAAQEQAIGTAQDYLDYSHFSRTGLIKQLKYEGFAAADATFAVDSLKVDWNKQAVGAAKDYLAYTHFSRQGLIDQLKYEGFTTAQAKYGATGAGL